MPILKVLFNMEVRGKENVPKSGGVILAANHLSFLDPPAIAIASPRRVYFLARKELFKGKMFGWLIRELNAMPISNKKLRVGVIKKSLEILKEGEALLLFPEGTRSPAGTISGGKRGVGLIAYKAKVPVVPVLIKGSDKALAIGAKWISLRKISIVFGKPIEPEEIRSKANKDFYQELSDNVMAEIKKLSVLLM